MVIFVFGPLHIVCFVYLFYSLLTNKAYLSGDRHLSAFCLLDGGKNQLA